MAIVITGRTLCPVCGEALKAGEKKISFPPFIANLLDPLVVFNDASFHEECFRRHPLAENAILLLNQMAIRTQNGHHTCEVCKQSIDDPNDYLSLGQLASEHTDPLFEYNFMEFHRHCTKQFRARERIVGLLEKLDSSGRWKGDSLRRLLNQI